jgi:succinoglycan biosynthesis protein ExoM
MNISVCIATYRRPELLRALLDDLARQRRAPQEVVVVDNDEDGSARATVDLARGAVPPFPIRYAIQPQKNIAVARNQSVALATGTWLAFIDDDERAPRTWLEQLAETADGLGADGVLGPVEPVLPAAAPAWLRRGRFYHWARMSTGTVVPIKLLRFGNVLLRAALLRTPAPPFDPDYGLTGGEDGDLLARLAQGGARLVWCDEAVVHEPVATPRLSLRWLLLRAMRGGQDFARHVLAGRHGPVTLTRRVALFARATVQAAAAGALAALSLPLGLHVTAYWLTKLSANLGKLSTFLGLHYREYG